MQGQLFTQDFLLHGIRETPPYRALAEGEFSAFLARLQDIYASSSAWSASLATPWPQSSSR